MWFQVFINPLKDNGCLSKEEMYSIFSTVEELYFIHIQLLKDLGDEFDEDLCLGIAYLKNVRIFE